MSTPDPAKPKPAIVPKPWQDGLGPYYIGLFLWVVFFDQLGLRALPVGGVLWAVIGAAVAGPLCYLLLFRVPAEWGQATGKPLPELAESSFGVAGARWVPGLLIGLSEIVWFSVAISYATDFTLRGLAEVRFLDERAFRTISLGGLRLKGPLFLATSLFWSVFVGLVGRRFVRLVGAIMYVFPVFPAMLLGGSMFAMLGGLRTFAPTGIDPMGLAVPAARAGVWSMMLVAQLVLGFFAMAGVLGADQRGIDVGARRPRRRLGVGRAGAGGDRGDRVGRRRRLPGAGQSRPCCSKARSARLEARDRRPSRSTSEIRTIGTPPEATFRALLTDGIGGKVGGGMLLVFGSIALAPAVFAAFVFGQRLNAALPRLSRTKWTLVGIALSWPMTAMGLFDRLEPVFTAMGALFAPVAACLAAESARHRGTWPGPRRGVNGPGMVGWAAGVVVGLLPLTSRRLASFQPATFWAFLAAFAAYWVAAMIVGESEPLGKDARAWDDDQGSPSIAPSTLTTAPTISSSTDSAHGEGSP